VSLNIIFNPSLLAAGVFGSIGMLAWGAAALVPLLLYLWNRQQYRESPWAAMEFLLAAVQEKARRLRIERLLLLMLRMAIPIALAIALADFRWQSSPSTGSSLVARPPTHHMFVVDLSWSMAYEVDGVSRLARAKQLVREIINDSPQGDGFTLVALSNPAVDVIRVPAFSRDDAIAELEGLEIVDDVADLSTALELVQQTLINLQANFPRLEKHNVYCVSDMGENTWNAVTTRGGRQQIDEIAALASVVTVDVGVEQPGNVAITSVSRNQSVVTTATGTVWQVGVERLAGPPQGKHLVEMLVEGKLADRQEIELNGGSATVGFEYQFDQQRQYEVAFRVVPASASGDSLSVDDAWHEIVVVNATYEILCLEGRAGSARNVAIALAPSDESPYNVRTIPDHRLEQTSLAGIDVLLLCNPGRFTSERRTQLEEYLKQGGSIVLFLGDLASVENYNRMLGAAEGRSAILPAELLEFSPQGTHRFAPGEYRHPIVDVFRGQDRSGLLTTPVWKYVRLAKPSMYANVALQFANGDPVIVEHAVLGGHVTLITIPPSEISVATQTGQSYPWTAWSAWPSFPPLIHEILLHSLSHQAATYNLRVGETFSSTIPSSSDTQVVTVRKPNGRTTRATAQPTNGIPKWSTSDTRLSGVYAVSLDDNNETPWQQFAVNLADTQEGLLRRIPAASLPTPFQRNTITANANGENSEASTRTTSLFRMMLGLLFVLLLAESCVACFLGTTQ